MNKHASLIHPTAVIAPSATLAPDVQIGAFTLIGNDVQIDTGTIIGSHCTIHGPTRIGRNNRFIGQAAIGGEPQDKKFAGEHTELLIGDNNTIREFVTINRGTGGGGGVTSIGNDNWILAYTHIAHDCHVGHHCVFSNNASLAGHVTVGDWVIFSGFSGAHQFCRIGRYAFIGMGTLINGDVPPFTLIGSDTLGRPRGINNEGLKRRNFTPERITAIKLAYRTLYVAGLPLAEAKQQLAEQAKDNDDIKELLQFIETAQRPLLR
ncbi:acyl-[acyl-carrier-protein]--UDP-N-acetylglucosamine O-acyltransferase [Xylella fastidiosa]|uniref:acyl-ACP--UDP-N-acetylglucosamine O-acyltransferase n=1 Tax=Xylella fastidiosa TaxID=2371 RepID=UPI0008FFFF14|nr:acyl-ACP--UDP-N-acetylglucosamine O-acyltransferase [Xylella fastidiosa]MDD0929729.1 acyl-ACP--UDP-N-acetylglucosamine O-acyltransferase [Xylella fastidiosa subsp. multiplex]QTX28258.1 acyl-ACP--UDP-N-acetylglucosamine O-acyltransferase [Xylella fastidiosa subsp. multiplex]TNV88714.1 acyl-[acyl-carrier-protein]--UDP-N-acetylglucosamine O-acyltransferase [Xylella fastidiosa]TNV98382.1 acyl-[acyl-carrier-protein]--UDP-N-acetylglucosamine O-acyltransferase [Xylella fastidiosa]UIT41550.1 acyl-A